MARARLDLPRSFRYTTELEVRVTDMNYGGHAGNDAILRFLQEARARFLREQDMTEMDVDGVGLIVADAVVIYRAESFFGDRLLIQLDARDVNRYGCDLVYRVDHAESGREIARAKTGIVFFDYGERRIARAPRRFLELVEDRC